MMRSWWLLISAAIVTALLAGCRKDHDQPGPQNRPEIMLFCGAGLRPPVQALISQFAEAEGVKVIVDYAGSEMLLSKMRLTGQGDLFMPGDRRYVAIADEQGLVSSQHRVCWFVPTILVSKGNPKAIRGLRDFLRSDVRIGLGDPGACAIGMLSRDLLSKNGIAWEAIEPSVQFQSVTVNELAVHVQAGSLDAVIVWDAVAKQYLRHTDEVPIPLDHNIVSTVAVSVLTSSQHPDLSGRFVRFARSKQGQSIFRQHGYRVEAPASAPGDER